MKKTLAATTVLALAMTSAANARGGINRNEWSTLSAETLQQLPPQISSTIQAAQKACGQSEPRVRTGFLRYLKGNNGVEFVSLHFDQFQCASSALCSSTGCLHRVFVTNGRQAREVWSGRVYEIGLSDRLGRTALNIGCDDFCNSSLLWNGSAFSRQSHH